MSNRIPPLLEPYLSLPPEAALILLTGVLGASTNWLVLRYLYAFLKGSAVDGDAASTGVVLVSFLRDGSFWREGAAKLGLDVEGMGRSGRFVFVDGLTGLYSGETTTTKTGQSGVVGGTARRVLTSSSPDAVRAEIIAAAGDLKTDRKILLLDQPDALLATSGEALTSQGLQTMILQLREHVTATVLTLASDQPLLHTQQTTLEREHAALVTGMAHAADGWLGARMLDTGVARDVSGVVRIARGEGGLLDWDERELLYHVGADGNVKVFERGT